MNGYWNRPDENARRTRGGWHHTNDLGRREPDGSISFIGPATRMIKSAAENIYPAEVERCIAAHPAVAECAVIGVPDAEVGPERQGDRGRASRRRRERRNDHRALSQRDRLVQEAAPRRVCRCAPPARLRRRLRRPRRAVRRRQLPRRPNAQRMTPFTDGSYRRRIRLVATEPRSRRGRTRRRLPSFRGHAASRRRTRHRRRGPIAALAVDDVSRRSGTPP